MHAHYTKKKIPRENRIWDTILGCQKCRTNSSETRISKCVTNMVRHHDQYEREEDGAMHVNIILVVLTERFQIMRDKEFTNEDSLNYPFSWKLQDEILKSEKMRMEDWSFFVPSRDIQVDSLFHKDWWISRWFLHMERIHISRGSSTSDQYSIAVAGLVAGGKERTEGRQTISSLLLIFSTAMPTKQS